MKYSPDSDRSRLLFGAFTTALLLVASCGGAHEEHEEQPNNAHNNTHNNHHNNADNNADNNHNNNSTTNNSNNAPNNSSSNNTASNNTAPNSSNNATPCPTPNACGGCAELSGVPGESCGSCADGTLTCEGTEALRCEGQSPPNACGGCARLEGAPDDPCGPCLRGVLACNGSDALTCQGDSTNPCGGCTELSGVPGESCGSCGDGALVCEGSDALACQGGSALNVCGGCAVLEGAPGEVCGVCEDGALACEGLDALVCEGATATCQDESLHCDDALDNDGDGLTDCEDDQCDHHDACGDWSCVDVDLGSALGRPVSDAVGTEPHDRWNAECLHQGVNKVVFKWTAPRDGLYSFEASGGTGSTRLALVQGDCVASPVQCARQLDSGANNEWRYALPLHLQAGESVLLLKEGPWKLSIAEQEIAAEFADARRQIGGERDFHGKRAQAIHTPQRTLIANPQLGLFSLYEFQSQPAPMLLPLSRHLEYGNNYDNATGILVQSNVGLHGDGTTGVYVAEVSLPSSIGRPHHDEARYHPASTLLSEWSWSLLETWRAPVLHTVDLTGDELPDLVTWGRDVPGGPAVRWEVYSNTAAGLTDPASAWYPLATPRATLEAPPYVAAGVSSAVSCDLNGDSQQDLLLLTVDAEGTTYTRHARVVYGPIQGDVDLTDAPLLALGEATSYYPSTAVEPPVLATDLNADGVCDLIQIRGGIHPESGRPVSALHVFLGPDLTSLEIEHATWSLWPPVAWGVGSIQNLIARDLNRDGHVDLLIANLTSGGGPTLDAAISRSGIVTVLLGPLTPDKQLGDYDLLIYDVVRENSLKIGLLGEWLVFADLDGDGVEEIFIGNPDGRYGYVFEGRRLHSLLER